MQKDKLSISDQITYMREKKGIKFNIVDEESAKIFLTKILGSMLIWNLRIFKNYLQLTCISENLLSK